MVSFLLLMSVYVSCKKKTEGRGLRDAYDIE